MFQSSIWCWLMRKLKNAPQRPLRSRHRICPRIELLEDRWAPADFTWAPPVGANDLWSDPRNWTVGGNPAQATPAANDNVIFNNGNNADSAASGAVVTLGGQNYQFLCTVSRVQVNGYTGTITLGQSLTVTTTFTESSGTIAGAFPINVNGGGTWSGGTLRGNGNPGSQRWQGFISLYLL